MLVKCGRERHIRIMPAKSPSLNGSTDCSRKGTLVIDFQFKRFLHPKDLMASKSLFMILAIVVLPSDLVLAKDYIVGDYMGWTIGFNYQTWAKGKEFFVGDRLVFKYPVGRHNVFKVNGTVFKYCLIPPPSEALTTGNDVITLATPGRKWYMCGVGVHCLMGGQKLFIEVLPELGITPADAPSPVEEQIAAPPAISGSRHGAQGT